MHDQTTIAQCPYCFNLIREIWVKEKGKKKPKLVRLNINAVCLLNDPEGHTMGHNITTLQFARGKFVPRDKLRTGEEYQEVYTLHDCRRTAFRSQRKENTQYRYA